MGLAPVETRLPKANHHFPHRTPLVGGFLSDELKDLVYGLGGNPKLRKRALGGREMVGIEGEMSGVWEEGSSVLAWGWMDMMVTTCDGSLSFLLPFHT